MTIWYSVCPMQVYTECSHTETWISRDSSGNERRSYEVNVRLGKALDVTSLKETVMKNFAKEAEYHKSTRESLFNSKELEEVDACPICNASVANSQFRLNIYGGRYHQCSICGHCFLIARPSELALKTFYTNDSHYSSTYVDKKSLETRVKEVATPKVEWVIEQFESIYDRRPTSILDIGAGGGHFVYASKQLGLDAKGIEVSKSSREFCRINFGFELEAVDFSQNWHRFSDVDVITFWGLIEHVPDPLSLLRLAHRTLYGRETMVVASAPHWDSFSTAVQGFFSNSVVRHLDPLGHLHIFTTSSLVTAFELCGFAPVAAWYFGMDAYELFTQLALSSNEKVTGFSGELLSNLQSAIDKGRQSDSIVLAGRQSLSGESGKE